MSHTRGAAAPTSVNHEHVSVDESELDRIVHEVADRAEEWSATTPRQRAELLERIVNDTLAVAEEWNAAACAAKGYDTLGPEGGEELFGGIGTFVHMAQLFRRSMLDLARHGRPRYPGPVRHKPGGRIAVQVVPSSMLDRLVFAGITGEVWMEPGVSERDVRATQAPAYRAPQPGASLVLGAGNVASLGPRDVLTKMFAEGKVVVLKAHPVNDYLVPYWSRAFASLIDAGYLRIVRGGVGVGSFLVGHDRIADVHVTGSDKTHDAIVFGAGVEGERRKIANDPLVTKPLTCELGNVSPVVIVPGEWTATEIDYQARHVASMIANNAGFNCLTPRVIITHDQWPQRAAFFSALESVFESLPTRDAYYPGARERHAMFLGTHPDAHQLGAVDEKSMPWTIVRDVDPSNVEGICLNVEAFCALTSETALAADSTADFIRRAVAFCNDVVWGTLSMTLLCDPRSMQDPDVGAALELAVADLRYGSIGVNIWHAMSYALASTTWGAYPGHPVTDIQSGCGVVGNAYLFAQAQKSVVRGPFVAKPAPAWFVTNQNAGVVMRKLLAFEGAPSWAKLPGLVASSLKG